MSSHGGERMRTRRNGSVYECVLVDLNTQWDFFKTQGPCRAANADALIPALRNIVAWTLRNQVPVISSLESHRPQELDPGGWPPHCLDDSGGQQKLRFTLLPNRVAVEGDNTMTVPLDLFQRHQQVIFRKRTTDLLANPKADRFLTQLLAREYLLFGLGLERSIKALALGLMARHRSVTIIVDGCGYWNAAAADFALRQLVAKGAAVVTVRELLTRKLFRPRRYSRLLYDSGNARPRGRLGVYPAPLPDGLRGTNGRSRLNLLRQTDDRKPSTGPTPPLPPN